MVEVFVGNYKTGAIQFNRALPLVLERNMGLLLPEEDGETTDNDIVSTADGGRVRSACVLG